jgi:hypothetical protein
MGVVVVIHGFNPDESWSLQAPIEGTMLPKPSSTATVSADRERHVRIASPALGTEGCFGYVVVHDTQ